MAIEAKLVKELRERTGVGMMDCKKALLETNGDIEKAVEFLRKAGQAKADKKASRVAAEGLVVIRQDNNFSVIAEINSETDFVAKDENFINFSNKVLDCVISSQPKDVDELMEIKIDDGNLESVRKELVAKVGENISVRRFFLLNSINNVSLYSHMGRIGVITELDGGNESLANDISMQIAASTPQYIDIDAIPENELNKEREILIAQALQEGKPQEIVAKMVDGRLRKHLSEITLLGQSFIKDTDTNVADLLTASGAKVISFTRYELGEGIVKEEQDFVAEVMAQASQ
ncbi:MAG: translation elongation factor Ts [Gammaproteobacteria bacterium TMED78]|mgnify:CR=1 FL=1|nr:MAG: translation elongation factor Ts [Gammaproteobacteria bacterium TMED78]|tara:strand:- start:119338 stop:120204 length:867 start_codon:yes stop_codon:yes gene_type:complete